jgi:hypothetical protein
MLQLQFQNLTLDEIIKPKMTLKASAATACWFTALDHVDNGSAGFHMMHCWVLCVRACGCGQVLPTASFTKCIELIVMV